MTRFHLIFYDPDRELKNQKTIEYFNIRDFKHFGSGEIDIYGEDGVLKTEELGPNRSMKVRMQGEKK